jgi:glycosyltransferase involved in cell wall biosynthesis
MQAGKRRMQTTGEKMRSGIAGLFSPIRSLFRASGNVETAQPVKDSVAILADGCESSIAYFITPEAARRGWCAGQYKLSTKPPKSIIAHGCRTVVVVRYLNKDWLLALKQFRKEGGKVIYFMDDDLLDQSVYTALPAKYARKLYDFAGRWRTDLIGLCDECWVSSQSLLHKYPELRPSVLIPKPPDLAAPNVAYQLFYHGTISHIAEMAWLAPVVDSLHQISTNIWFEIFGDHTVNKMFKRIPRVSVQHPLSWLDYLTYTSTVKRNIGLAPLLPTKFNSARSITKFFDFARMGAFGIYSDVVPYNEFVRHDVDGILLPNDPEQWVATISELLQDPERMQRLSLAAQRRVSMIAAER